MRIQLATCLRDKACVVVVTEGEGPNGIIFGFVVDRVILVVMDGLTIVDFWWFVLVPTERFS